MPWTICTTARGCSSPGSSRLPNLASVHTFALMRDRPLLDAYENGTQNAVPAMMPSHQMIRYLRGIVSLT